jgi:hypothetical protein
MGEEADAGKVRLLHNGHHQETLKRATSLVVKGRVEALALVFVLDDGSTGHSVSLSASNNAALVGELEAAKLDVLIGDGRHEGRDDGVDDEPG